MENLLLGRVRVLVGAVLLVAVLAFGTGASAVSFEALYDFCSETGCIDGDGPEAALVMDLSGNLYGTTSSGGAHNRGAVFELMPNTTKTAWKERVLYSFGSQIDDGQWPTARLIIDASGNLYGTTSTGGAHGGGTVFELRPNASGTVWTETVLWGFGAAGDGSNPYAGLVMDTSGHLFGTLYNLGIFELTPNAAKTAWTEKILYKFCSQGAGKCTDGDGPYYATLIMDKSGNLYGTTIIGGLHGDGVVFELTANAARTSWAEKVLYNFCSEAKCADGSRPVASLLMDTLGNLYGTTSGGGAHGDGTVFKLTSNTAKTAWTETVLWSFGGAGDGAAPSAEVIMDASGNLRGTTFTGGIEEGGTIFTLIPNAAKTVWTETVLSFCSPGNCTNGSEPYAGLIMDKSGNLYGTTWANGLHGGGTVFEQ